jgi:hypothetical protein
MNKTCINFSMTERMPACKSVVVLAGLLGLVGLASGATVENSPEVRLSVPNAETLRAAQERHREFEERATFELRAVGDVGGDLVAMIDLNGHPVMAVVPVTFAGWEVREITMNPPEVKLWNFRENRERILTLTNPREVTFPVVSEEAIDRLLTPDRRNIPRLDVRHIPMEVTQEWINLGREGQEAILMNYLSMGMAWGPLVMSTDLQPTESFRAMLWQEKRMAIRMEKKRAFLDSLNDEQQAVFNKPSPAINFAGMTSTEANQRMRRWFEEVEAEKKKLIESFTPKQKALYDDYQGMPTDS